MPALQEECVTEIWCPTSKSIGSGYLIGPDVVLTACHVVGEIGQGLHPGLRITVRPLDDAKNGRPRRVARIAWPKPEDWVTLSQLDVALLAIEPDPYTRSIARRVALGWGNLSKETLISVSATGFPRFKYDEENNTRDTQQIFGDVAPLSGARSRMFEIEHKGRGPRGHEDWSGISGAALFAEGRLIGVVKLKVEDGYVDFKAARLEDCLKHPDFQSLVTRYTASGTEASPVKSLRDLTKLVCLADRDPQENMFKPAFLKLLTISPSPPLCCVILGKSEHRCDELVMRFALDTIPRLRKNRGEPVEFRPIAWPREVADPEVEISRLRDALWAFISDEGEITPAADDEFRLRLEDQSRPYLFQSEIAVELLDSQQAALLARWLTFWNRLRSRAPGRPPVHLINIRNGTDEQIEPWLKLVQIPTDAEWCRLPELESCLWQDLGEWIDNRVRVWTPKIENELQNLKEELEVELGGPTDFSIAQLKNAVRNIAKSREHV